MVPQSILGKRPVATGAEPVKRVAFGDAHPQRVPPSRYQGTALVTEAQESAPDQYAMAMAADYVAQMSAYAAMYVEPEYEPDGAQGLQDGTDQS